MRSLAVRARQSLAVVTAGLCLLVVAIVAGIPTTAAAHAVCDKGSPADESEVDEAPAQVWCDFNEPPVPGSTLKIYDDCNRRGDDGNTVIAGYRMMIGMTAKAPGRYRVVYHTVSATDGHSFSDYWSFRVKGNAPCPVASAGGGTPTATPTGSNGKPGGPSVRPSIAPTTQPDDSSAPPVVAPSQGASPPGDRPAENLPPIAIGDQGFPKRPGRAWPMAAALLVVIPMGIVPVLATRRRG